MLVMNKGMQSTVLDYVCSGFTNMAYLDSQLARTSAIRNAPIKIHRRIPTMMSTYRRPQNIVSLSSTSLNSFDSSSLLSSGPASRTVHSQAPQVNDQVTQADVVRLVHCVEALCDCCFDRQHGGRIEDSFAVPEGPD